MTLITFNVQGTTFVTNKEKILEPMCGHTNHLLKTLLSTNIEVEKDKDGNIFIDYPSDYILPILKYISSGFDPIYGVWIKDLDHLKNYEAAANYLGLTNLAECMKNLNIWVKEPCFYLKATTSQTYSDYKNIYTYEQIKDAVKILREQQLFINDNNITPKSGKSCLKRKLDANDFYYQTKYEKRKMLFQNLQKQLHIGKTIIILTSYIH